MSYEVSIEGGKTESGIEQWAPVWAAYRTVAIYRRRDDRSA
jgi:hypothetical protein